MSSGEIPTERDRAPQAPVAPHQARDDRHQHEDRLEPLAEDQQAAVEGGRARAQVRRRRIGDASVDGLRDQHDTEQGDESEEEPAMSSSERHVRW
jgi:hypothetical protein